MYLYIVKKIQFRFPQLKERLHILNRYGVDKAF